MQGPAAFTGVRPTCARVPCAAAVPRALCLGGRRRHAATPGCAPASCSSAWLHYCSCALLMRHDAAHQPATMPLNLYHNTLGASRRPAAGRPRLTLVPVTSVRMSATCVQLMASRTTGIVWPAYFSGSANTTARRARMQPALAAALCHIGAAHAQATRLASHAQPPQYRRSGGTSAASRALPEAGRQEPVGRCARVLQRGTRIAISTPGRSGQRCARAALCPMSATACMRSGAVPRLSDQVRLPSGCGWNTKVLA